MRKFVTVFGLMATFIISSSTAFAHHGVNAEYDAAHPITMKGTVTEYAFANPHIQVYFDVKGDDGRVTHWGCEGPSPGRLIRDGWPRNALKAGDQITITCDPARSGNPVGALRNFVLPDGRVLSAVPQPPPQ